jgi:molybdopterin molybdotransferase
LRPQEIGVLATVGRTWVKAYPRPRAAVVVTGDELVEGDEVPGPGQIRNSNGPMLAAQVRRAGAIPRPLGIARDRAEHLRARLAEGLESPILVLSGGVSAGKLDLVPGVLQELNVQPRFHKVKLKPGKPVFFGTHERGLVFGLPGNPVSAMVCFELFVRPAIRRLAGHGVPGPVLVRATLAEDFPHRSDRPTYHPAWLKDDETGRQVRAVPWFGSPDLRSLTRANCFVVLPAGDHLYRAGTPMSVLRVED